MDTGAWSLKCLIRMNEIHRIIHQSDGLNDVLLYGSRAYLTRQRLCMCAGAVRDVHHSCLLPVGTCNARSHHHHIRFLGERCCCCNFSMPRVCLTEPCCCDTLLGAGRQCHSLLKSGVEPLRQHLEASIPALSNTQTKL